MHSLQPLLTQFRSRYPIGSLVSEFLTVHDGSFVVRALVQMGGTTVATGLAIASDLEQAEDRAKVRALESLGLGAVKSYDMELPRVTDLPSHPLDADMADSGIAMAVPETAAPPYLSLPALDTFTSSPLGFPADNFSPISPINDSLPPVEEPIPARIVADLYTHIAEGDEGGTGADLDEEPVDLSKIVTPASQLLGKTPRRKTAPEDSAEPLPSEPLPSEPLPSAPEPVPAAASVDFSDVLMETDVELRRLGWDSKKGREYLKKTYGKRSRQELSETELYDFLEYLKTQPSLGQTPF